MSVEDDIKLAELELKRIEIKQREKDLSAKARFGLAGAAVLVTVVGGLSAVLFQGFGIVNSYLEKTKAEVTARSDFDFKGLELFVKEQEHLITCDPEESNRNIRLFQALFSERVTGSFNEIVTYRSQKCVTQSANSAANRAKNAAQSPEQVNAAADAARYTAAAQQSPLLAAATGSGPTQYRVVIHINSESDRPAALSLQRALVQKGFSAPGIEVVSSAPNSYQVRYYYSGQSNDAKNVAALATSELGLAPGSIQIPAALENTYKALPKNTMEFWFPRRSSDAS